jgi:hypothetical protein
VHPPRAGRYFDERDNFASDKDHYKMMAKRLAWPMPRQIIADRIGAW